MKVLTVSQASQYSTVDKATIITWIEEGLIPAEKSAGGHQGIKLEDLDRILQERGISPDPAALRTGKKILVVDDDKIVVETIVQSLEEDEHGYELISASDGFEAQAQIKHFRPDLLLLDIMMPDINGYEVCKKIKSDPETKNTKIIVLSAYLDEESHNRMKSHGADACFSKPLPLPELKKLVAEMLLDKA